MGLLASTDIRHQKYTKRKWMGNYLIYAKIGNRVSLLQVNMSVKIEQVLEPENMESHVGKMESDRLQEIIKCSF